MIFWVKIMISKDKIIHYLLELTVLDKNPEKICENFLNLFKGIINYKGWAFLILSEETNQFEFLRVEELKKNYVEEIKSLIEEGLIDWVLERKTPVTVPLKKNLASSDESFFIIPLVIKNKKIGAVILLCLTKPNLLGEITPDLFALAAGQTALTIENFLLREELDRQRKEEIALSKISGSVEANKELDEILMFILKLALEETQSEYGFFLKIDEKKKKISPWISFKVPLSRVKKCPFSLARGAIGYVASTGKTLIVDNYPEDARFKSCVEFVKFKPKNLVSVPVKINQKKMVILTLCNTRPFYTRDDLDFLFIIATYTAVIIKNKLLYNELRQSFLDTVNALVQTVEAKDPYIAGHSQRVTEYSLEIGRYLKLSRKEMEMIRFCGLLHDIGKIGISDSLLNKPSPLREEEYELIKEHPIIGEQIVKEIKFLELGVPLIRHHHERYDGKGYPDGLEGEKIPLLARILTVADAFDAMVSTRPYRRALTFGEAKKELEQKAGTQFDPRIVKIFCKILDKGFSSKKRETHEDDFS